jgi:transcriptional regulator with XRE-family HTH domain
MRIKEVIKEKGLTIAEVAEKMGSKQPTLSQQINGNPTIETLQKIADVIGVNVTEFFEPDSGLYGLVTFKGKIYKIDSSEKLQKLVEDVNSLSSEK